MKERVMAGLEEFTKEKEFQANPAMFEIIAKELGLGDHEMYQRAKNILKHILHNYAFFDIVTIDKFNHRLLRTFAYDLKLPMNFEVVIDTPLLLEEVTDKLIYNAGKDKLLTKVLIDFALEKADNDKSWDISKDLYRIAKLLLKEDYLEHLSEVQNKSLYDLQATGEKIRQQISILEKEIVNIAASVLANIDQNNLDFTDFTRSSLPKFFQKVAQTDLSVGFETQWQQNIASVQLYTNKKIGSPAAVAIDKLQPWLAEQHETIKTKVIALRYRDNLLKNLTPLSLLSSINQLLQQIKEEENILLISEFNQIISKEIGTQPAPFIYERIGEKYRHYFIDEFQDTSRMQWENLIPLIANALESESLSGKRGTLMLVGDAKQAIYRWRGGLAEQFISLYDIPAHNPFQVDKHIFQLPRNFRSCEEIINFNNNFFAHISSYLSNPYYQNLFKEHSYQETNKRQYGYVQLSFIDKDFGVDKSETYCELAFNTISQVIKEGKALSDICILTRRKKEGIAMASFLTEKNIPIISSESLLLKNDDRIQFLVTLMRHATQPQNKELIASLLIFISHHSQHKIHETIEAYLENITGAFKLFNFEMTDFQKLPLAEAITYAIYSFDLQKDSDAYLQYFLDEILDYSLHNNLSFTDFLAYWEKKEDNLSIVSPPEANAVKIMTIHKSKGLEFPVVIYPFADSKITQDLDREIWLPVSQDEFGIKTALFTRNKDLASFNEQTQEMCEAHEAKLQLDQYNILYVALTRAVEQLYIFTTKDLNVKGLENTDTYAGLFINYLKGSGRWNDAENTFVFGKKPLTITSTKNTTQELIPFASQNPLQTSFKVITKSGSLWETVRESALEKGNLYHLLLANIKYNYELEEALEEAVRSGTINTQIAAKVSLQLKEILRHPELMPYFSTDYTIYNEYDIYTRNGKVIRPDRLVINSVNEAVIIDYKTGSFSPNYVNQLNTYAEALSEMGYKVTKRLLVFINDTIEVKAL